MSQQFLLVLCCDKVAPTISGSSHFGSAASLIPGRAIDLIFVGPFGSVADISDPWGCSETAAQAVAPLPARPGGGQRCLQCVDDEIARTIYGPRACV